MPYRLIVPAKASMPKVHVLVSG